MSLLRAARPPVVSTTLQVWTLSDFTQLAALRADLCAALPAGDLREMVAVVATELATNGLRHGTPPTTVRLASYPGGWLLDVSDREVAGIPYVDGNRPFGQGGLGLLFAHRMSTASGWYVTAEAKHVWAVFGAAGR